MPVSSSQLSLHSAPVLAVLVCHNGAEWLPETLSALAESTVRPRHVLAVDTGSDDDTPALLSDAAERPDPVLDGVLTLAASTGFAAAMHEAVEHARERWGDPGSWLWVLHDDCAPEPDCLDILLRSADASPSAGVLGPLALDWAEPRLIVDAGVSTDSSGHRRQVVAADAAGDAGQGEPEADVLPEQTTEVLAVPSAGALISRQLWDSLGGFDPGLPVFGEDVDFGWRANVAGSLVLCVPPARLRHAQALSTGRRQAAALRVPVPVARRAHGLRTFLVNCSLPAFLLGVPRLAVLCVLRSLGFVLVRDGARAHAELAAAGYILGGAAGLRAARAGRAHGSVRGLFVSRFTRLRAALRGGVLKLVRRRVASEAVLGRMPRDAAGEPAWHPPGPDVEDADAPRPAGPNALPAGAARPARSRVSSLRGTGLRKPAEVVAVAVPQREHTEYAGQTGQAGPVEASEQAQPAKPSPGDEPGAGELLFVEVSRRRIIAATVLAPPVVLAVVLTAFALGIHWGRLGVDLAGGQLLPVGQLGQVWSAYLAAWHPVAGGTGTAAPVALAVLGILGAPLVPIGGPAALVAFLLIGNIPLAGLSAYAASARLPVHRWLRAGIAAAYGLLPVAAAAVAQGRLPIVVVHILLPPLIAGIGAVLTRSTRAWLSVAVGTALSLAVVGAFSPLAHALALLGLLAGVLVTRWPGGRVRAVSAVAIVVLLPLGLLLPWLPTLVRHPGLLLAGIDGSGRGMAAPLTGLAGLDPGGPGALAVGAVLVLAAVVAVAVRPTVRALPGVAVCVLGAAAVAVVRLLRTPAAAGYPGVGLLAVGAGLLMVVLGACAVSAAPGGSHRSQHASPVPGVVRKLAAAGTVVVVLALAAGGVLAGGGGPLHAGGGPHLVPSLERELARTSRAVLVLGSGPEQPRQVAGRLPRFGDDALSLPDAGSNRLERLQRLQRGLLAGERGAVTSAVAAGVLFVVLPPGRDGANLRQSVPELVAPAPPTSDGRTVLRLSPVGGPVILLAPVEAHLAVSEQAPSGELTDGRGAAVVAAELPDVRVRVSDGPAGRLLVLAAELTPGWSATVNGKPVPLVPAWGHQVGVAVPEQQSEVVVTFSSARWDVLLLFQVAALLFALLTAIPGRRTEDTTAR